MTKDELVDAHRKAKTDRELAAIEEKLDALVKVPAGKGRPRQRRVKAVAELTGQSQYVVDQRSRLRTAGAVADPLWRAIEAGDLTLRGGVRILCNARKQARASGRPVRLVVEQQLADYVAIPSTRSVGDKQVRVALPGTRKPLREAARVTSTRTIWMKIRALLRDHLASRLADVDERSAEVLWREFETELRVLTDSFSSRVDAARRRARRLSEEPVSLSDVVSACATLSIDEPLPGAGIDLPRANKNKKRLCAQYHPDRHNGSEEMRELYEAVLAAYEILVRYNEQLGRPHLRVLNGGAAANGDNHG